MTWYKTSTFLLLLFTAIFLTACSDDREKSATFLQQGIEYQNKGELRQAILEFRNAVKTDPKNSEAHYKLGLTYLKTGAPLKALKHLQRASSLNPDNINAHIKVARLLTQAKPDEARFYAKKVLTIHPDNQDALLVLARIESITRNYEQATAFLKKINQLNPNNTEMHLAMAQIFIQQNKLDQAEAELHIVLKNEPKNIDAYKNLVALHFARHDLEATTALLQKMTQLFPDSSEGYLGLAILAWRRHNFKQAEDYIAQAVTKHPEDKTFSHFQIRFFKQTGQLDKAEASLKKLIAARPEQREWKSMLANLYMDMGNHEQAEKLVAEILKTNSKEPMALLVRARLDARAHKTNDALYIVEGLLRDIPKWSEAHLLKSRLLLDGDQIENSLQEARLAVRYGGDNFQAHHNLASINFLKKDYREAAREAGMALRLQPADWKAALLLARSLLAMGQLEDAAGLLEKLRSRIENQPDILLVSGQCFQAMEKPDRAAAMFQAALTAQPDFVPALKELVNMALRQGQVQKAGQLIDQQLAAVPDNSQYLFLKARLLLHNQQPEKALVLLDKLKALDPDNPKFYRLSARAYTTLTRPEAAKKEYAFLLEKYPDDVDALMNLAILHENGSQRDTAADLYRKILVRHPNFAPAANNLALYLLDQPGGDLGEALRLATIAREKMPDNPDTLDTLGWVYFKRKAYSLAVPQLQEAARLAPGNPTIQKHLTAAENMLADEKESSVIFRKAPSRDTKENKFDFGSLSIGEHINSGADSLNNQ